MEKMCVPSFFFAGLRCATEYFLTVFSSYIIPAFTSETLLQGGYLITAENMSR